jgi:hypothetical protein
MLQPSAGKFSNFVRWSSSCQNRDVPQAADFTSRWPLPVKVRSLARPKQPLFRHSIPLGGSGIDCTSSPEVEVHARRRR